MSLIIVHILLHHKLWSNTVDWLCGPERIAGNWSGITVSGKLTVGGARLVAIEAAPGQSTDEIVTRFWRFSVRLTGSFSRRRARSGPPKMLPAPE
jgi:hypothetical protein